MPSSDNVIVKTHKSKDGDATSHSKTSSKRAKILTALFMQGKKGFT